jgi:lysophospholipid acyltransferase (LPLAT)-like uncharacterized protein
VVRLLGLTWRVRLDPPDLYDRVKDGGAAVYAFWHGRLLVPAYAFRGSGVSVMVSRHADGEVIARVAERLGFGTVRGSTTRGGAAALHDAIGVLRSGRAAAFTPDGPRGPREVAQPGAVFAASRAGAPLVPAGIGVRRAWVFGSWDRFRIPKPFTTVVVLAGEPLLPPADVSDGALEEWRLRFERSLHALNEEADRRASGKAP